MLLLKKCILVMLMILFCCCKNSDAEIAPENSSADAEENSAEENSIEEDISASLIAARIAVAFDDRQLAAQVIISGIDGKGRLSLQMRSLLEDCPAGGVMLFRYNLDTDNEAIQQLIKETKDLIAENSKVELPEDEAVLAFSVLPFIAVDHEGASVNRFKPGTADLPAAAMYADAVNNNNENIKNVMKHIINDSYNAGQIINSLGINVNFAPVAEFLTKDNSDFLGNRVYSSDPVFTTQAAAAFILGMKQANVLCAVKHFPGSAGKDPHYFTSVLEGGKAVLDMLTVPFTALIGKGYTRAIMVSHSAVPALDSQNISSLSPIVMKNWLRHELGFNGIIICDDFSMAAAKNFAGSAESGSESALTPEAAAVKSLAAGADMILVWQPDLQRTHRAIQAALDDGTLSREHLREAVTRIVFEKLRLGSVKIWN